MKKWSAIRTIQSQLTGQRDRLAIVTATPLLNTLRTALLSHSARRSVSLLYSGRINECRTIYIARHQRVDATAAAAAALLLHRHHSAAGQSRTRRRLIHALVCRSRIGQCSALFAAAAATTSVSIA